MRHIPLLAIVLVLFSLSGCIAVGGRRDTTPPTLGRELIDMKTALDQGAITCEEYEQAKANLIVDGRTRVSYR